MEVKLRNEKGPKQRNSIFFRKFRLFTGLGSEKSLQGMYTTVMNLTFFSIDSSLVNEHSMLRSVNFTTFFLLAGNWAKYLWRTRLRFVEHYEQPIKFLLACISKICNRISGISCGCWEKAVGCFQPYQKRNIQYWWKRIKRHISNSSITKKSWTSLKISKSFSDFNLSLQSSSFRTFTNSIATLG